MLCRCINVQVGDWDSWAVGTVGRSRQLGGWAVGRLGSWAVGGGVSFSGAPVCETFHPDGSSDSPREEDPSPPLAQVLESPSEALFTAIAEVRSEGVSDGAAVLPLFAT